MRLRTVSIFILFPHFDSNSDVRRHVFLAVYPTSVSLSLSLTAYLCPFDNLVVDMQWIGPWIISRTATSSITGPLVTSATAVLRACSQPPSRHQQERRRRPLRRKNIDTPAYVSIDKDPFFLSEYFICRIHTDRCHRFHLDESWPIFSNHWNENLHPQQSYLCQPNDVPVLSSSQRWSIDLYRCFNGFHFSHVYSSSIRHRLTQHSLNRFSVFFLVVVTFGRMISINLIIIDSSHLKRKRVVHGNLDHSPSRHAPEKKIIENS